MYKLEVFPSELNLSEIFQSLDIKFALVNDDGQQVQMEGKCRDFLGDVIWSELTGHGEYSIYGSIYDPEEIRWTATKARVSMKFPDAKNKKYFIKHLPKLNDMEIRYGLSPTIFHETEEPLRIVVEGDVTWVSHEWKISLYSFLLKISSYYSPKSIRSPDDGYFELWKTDGNADFLMRNIKTDVTKHENNIISAHNRSGFVSILRKDDHIFRQFFN